MTSFRSSPANHAPPLKEGHAAPLAPSAAVFFPVQIRFPPAGRGTRAADDEQRRGGLHRPQAGLRPMLQPLVRGEVPEGRPERRPVRRDLPEVPAVRAEGHPGEGHPDRRGGLHGPQQGQARELTMDRRRRAPPPERGSVSPRGPLSTRRAAADASTARAREFKTLMPEQFVVINQFFHSR